jgi:signal transduction histidine kinase
MIRLFAKLFGGLILTLAVSFLIQTWIIDYAQEILVKHHGAVDFRERFRPVFSFVEASLAPYPRAEWPARFEALRPSAFTYPAKVLGIDEVGAQADQSSISLEMIREGKIAAGDRAEGGFRLFKRLGDSAWVLELEFPGTPSIRNMLIAINFGIEAIIVALILFLWVRPFWRDLMKLNRAAQDVGEGRFDVPVAMPRGSPLFPLAESFNTMRERIAGLLRSHRELTNAVSHELKTPIASLRFRQALAQEDATAAGKDAQLVQMGRTLDRLDQLSGELLDYARLDRASPALHACELDAACVLDEAVADAREYALARGRRVAIEALEAHGTIHADPYFLARAISNLLRNAVLHAAGRIQVSLVRQDGNYLVTVDDDGPGIPPGQREAVFAPFTRLDDSRQRDTGGSGMGLAIVKQVARWHGGEAAIATAPSGGVRATLAWPIPASRAPAAMATAPAAESPQAADATQPGGRHAHAGKA